LDHSETGKTEKKKKKKPEKRIILTALNRKGFRELNQHNLEIFASFQDSEESQNGSFLSILLEISEPGTEIDPRKREDECVSVRVKFSAEFWNGLRGKD